MNESGPCPFCGLAGGRLLFREALVSALWDAFPVSEGHTLIIPNRHVVGWSEATEAERVALTSSLERVRDHLRERFAPDGFNVGFNDGTAAGQTVPHLHIHAIPRGRSGSDRRREARHPGQGQLPRPGRPGCDGVECRADADADPGRRRPAAAAPAA
jgi:diadenosine tetraphosphate (Ap4A) HIT family hydrolase